MGLKLCLCRCERGLSLCPCIFMCFPVEGRFIRHVSGGLAVHVNMALD
jgi:hypothetical protein